MTMKPGTDPTESDFLREFMFVTCTESGCNPVECKKPRCMERKAELLSSAPLGALKSEIAMEIEADDSLEYIARRHAMPTVATLDAVIERLDRLRAGGVAHFSIPGVIEVHFAPPEPKAPKPTRQPETPTDPLEDPRTYPGGRVPGYARAGVREGMSDGDEYDPMG